MWHSATRGPTYRGLVSSQTNADGIWQTISQALSILAVLIVCLSHPSSNSNTGTPPS